MNNHGIIMLCTYALEEVVQKIENIIKKLKGVGE
jgi:hypothetical protein